MKRFGKVMLYILAAVIVLLALVHLGVTAVYHRFFMNAESRFLVPGMDSPFVQQGLDYVQEKQVYLISGYMDDGSASRIYVREDGGDVRYVELKNANGTDYTRQCGGICYNGGYVYVAGKNGMEVFTLNDVLDGGNATAVGRIEMGFDVDFCTFRDGYLLAGQNNDNLIVLYRGEPGSAFGIASKAVAAIAVPDQVRGVCITGEDEIVLSTSDGLASSYLSYCHVSGQSTQYITVSETQVPLYSLETTEQVAMPPMSRGLLDQDGKVLVMFQSASNKYVFGKFIRGYQVVAFGPEE